MKPLRLALFACLVIASAISIAQEESKGQEQLKGISGKFGATYTLSNQFNFTLLSAKYELKPANAYEIQKCIFGTKLVVLDMTLKNVSNQDNYFNPGDLFTLVDDKQNIYSGGSAWVESTQRANNTWTLRPGQGIGQAALNDPFRIAFRVPGDAKIDKIMLNMGRAGHDDEKVIRYNLVEPTKEAASAGKNFIAALPVECQSPHSAWGAVLAPEGKGAIGKTVPSGYFSISLDSVGPAPAGTTYAGSAPEEGKIYWVATFTCTNLTDQDLGMFDMYGGDTPSYLLTDADGEQYRPLGYRKKNTDEDSDRTLKRGEKYSFRVFFFLDQKVKPNHIVYGTGDATKWGCDLPPQPN